MTSDLSVPEGDVLARASEALDDGETVVLATVVGVEGSAYRRPGAKMVVTPDGGGLGAITAGCLEDEVLSLAGEVLSAGERRVETYDLMEDDDDVWGMGVGCNGIIDILLEPVDETYEPGFEAYRDREPVAVLTVRTESGPGARGYYRPATGVTGLDETLAAAIEDPAAELLAAGRSETVTVETDGRSTRVFVDAITPPPELLVLGSGHDVGPVVELGTQNGFRTTVAAFRGAADPAERFPAADRTVSTSPARLGETLDLGERTYAVVMTHNFVDDRLAVEQLLDSPVPYVGLMGPRDRFEEMLEDFAAEGTTFDDEDLAPLFTPVGLDLGAGSPHGIATSIVAEVLAVHNDRTPQHLQAREGDIHERVSLDGTGTAAGAAESRDTGEADETTDAADPEPPTRD